MFDITLSYDIASAGAKMLDEKRPGWYKLIDPSALNIQSMSNCIAGQLGQAEGKNYFGFLDALDVSVIFGAKKYGFDASPEVTFEQLQEAWLQLIAERLVADVVVYAAEAEILSVERDLIAS